MLGDLELTIGQLEGEVSSPSPADRLHVWSGGSPQGQPRLLPRTEDDLREASKGEVREGGNVFTAVPGF